MSGAVARRYARALLELATEGNVLGQIEGELKYVLAILDASPDLKRILFHPAIVVAEKRNLVEQVFGNQISALSMNFLNFVVDRRREIFLSEIIIEFVHLANEVRNLVDAEVVTAVEFSDEELAALKARLVKLTGKTVNLKPVVDPGLIGGAVVKMGDQIIDGSIASKLTNMRDTLMQIR